MPDRSTLENKAVEAYLQYLATGVVPADPKDVVDLETLDQRIANEERLHVKVTLIAHRHRLANPPPPDPSPLVDKFVQYAATFGERNKVTYPVWREMGVPARVLKEAGIPMSGMRSSNGAVPAGTKLAPNDPRRIRTYRPRRPWTDSEKSQYVAIFDDKGVEAAMAHFDLDCTVHAAKQRYFQFRRQLGLPNKTKGGRRRKDASQAT